MTRDEFFVDVTKALRLLASLGVPELQADVEGKIASMRTGGAGVTPDDLRRYADTIDWARQGDPRLLGELATVLLRIVAGLASEVESFRSARE
jgi:hypothetical protein